MSFLPIDIQTIIGQMGAVSKIQHSAENAPLVQQNYLSHAIKKESEIKDNRVDSTEKTGAENNKVDPDAENLSNLNKQKQNNKHSDKDDAASGWLASDDNVLNHDPSLGNIIDVKK